MADRSELESDVPVVGIRSPPGTAARASAALPDRAIALLRAAGNRATARALARQPVTQAVARDIQHPEDFPTYESWLAAISSSFHLADRDPHRWSAFPAGDVPQGFPLVTQRDRYGELVERPSGGVVLGDRPATTDADAPARIERRPADRFIDHPTDAWVRTHLPARLRDTAYRLPTDCADIAVVLRHVWLAYHRRTQQWTYRAVNGAIRSAVIGYSERGTDAERNRLAQEIRPGDVDSVNVDAFIHPYRDATGRRLRSFAALAPLLQPGDVLVWEHHADGQHRSGGHTQTIAAVRWGAGRQITSLVLLQGNQPIFDPQAHAIRRFERLHGQHVDSRSELGESPGRRIERAHLDLRAPHTTQVDGEPVWSWGDPEHTWLIAAGPPARADPRPTGAAGAPSPRRWVPMLRAATSRDALLDALESALAEARQLAISGGAAASELDDVIDAAGEGIAGIEAGGHEQEPAAELVAEFQATLAESLADDVQAPQLRALAARLATAAGAAGTLAAHITALRAVADITQLERRFRLALGAIAGLATRPGSTVDAHDAAAIGHAAGAALWRFATAAQHAPDSPSPSRVAHLGGLAHETHFRVIRQLERAIDDAVRGTPRAQLSLEQVRPALEEAARGATTLSFDPATDPARTVRVLVVGFDPFGSDSNDVQAPPADAWNPSAAAALDLDGRQVDLPAVDGEAVVEGIVLPVSFRQFNESGGDGIVEDYVGRVAGLVDVVLTISMDTDASQPTHIERFAIGMHRLDDGRLTRVRPDRPLLVSTPAPLDAIAAQAGADPEMRGIAAPVVDTALVLRVTDVDARDVAAVERDLARRLGPQAHASGQSLTGRLLQLTVTGASRAAALRLFDTTSPTATVHLAGRPRAVQLVEGPGGNFLSNEVAYRTQAFLESQRRRRTPTSFHVHVPLAPEVPAQGANAAQIQAAADARRRTIATVRALIRSTAEEVLARRRHRR